ncbi:MAG TPA: hypothetical protein DEW46_11930 [Verrucomicrobia bacterium]|jgi:glycosyltransferase involved in cell wall biosynthesis|nr:hypothetical protein [Verrucomicrobiota bacterium]
MIVLHAITDLEVGGAETLLTAVLQRLRPRLDQIHVAYFYGNSWIPNQLAQQGIVVHKLPSAYKADPRGVWALCKLIRKIRPDILHSHLIQGDWAASVARTLARSRCPHISTKHNLHYFKGHPGWTQGVDARFNRRLSAMITVSQAVAEDYQAQCRVGTDRIRVIPNGIDLDRFSTPETPRAETRRALAIPEEAPVLITVASLTAQKGHTVMLQAIEQLVDTFPNLIWVIVGGGKLKDQIEALADRPATRRHCRFLGNRQDVPDLLHASDLFVLPSLWEGFGIAALEAAAAGLPLVLSRTGGMVEVFAGPEEAALFATPGNAGELAQQIRTLLQDPTLHRQLSLQARARAEQYDLNTIAQQWFDLYRSLVDGTGL